MTTEMRYCEECGEDTLQRYQGEDPVRGHVWVCVECTASAELRSPGGDDA